MAPFSDQEIDSITWKQVKKFAAAHGASFWVSGGSWDFMDLASKRLFLADLELVCGVEFRLDTMTPQVVSVDETESVFVDFLDRAGKTVSGWPKWKREILG